MFGRKKSSIVFCVVSILFFILSISPIILAQEETNDAKITERYKLMLSRNPKEGSAFDRLYQFYLEGPGLDAMVADYKTEAQAKPEDSNFQLILGHLYKRLGKDTEALTAYQRAVELSQNNYYPHFALGKMYATLRQHENAIIELTKAVELTEQTQSTSPEELTKIYKVLGRSYFSRDKVKEAISVWSKIAELDPENIFARIELADLFYEQNLYPQAIAQHKAILEIKKDDPYRKCLSLREIGKIHEDTGAYEKARKHYDEALTLTAPGNWLRKDLQQRIIDIYAADGNWEGLIGYYQTKLETSPNDPELLGLLAAAFIENQQLDESITTYRKGLELAPTDSGLRLNLITALRNAEKFEEAAAEYEVLIEQHPDDFGIYRELGKLYVQLENVDKAKAVYQKMIDRNPQNASTYLILAEIYTGHEWIEDAVTAYQKAIALASENLDYIEYFGEFYFRQGDREKAVETWNQMVVDDKSTAENHDRLARLLDTKKFPSKAIEASRKAVALMPDAYRYRETLAKRLMKNGKYEDALTEYAEAEKLAPNAFFAEQMADQRIEIYRRQGTLVAQIETVEDQLKKQTGNAEATFALQMRLAKMYLKLGNITYGLEVLLEAKTLRPNDIVVNRRLSEVYTKQNRQGEANVIYTHLIEIDSANAREYYANIARAHLNTMDFKAATEAAKQVVAHSPRNPEGHQLLAQIAKGSGDYGTAITSLKQAIRLRPDATDIRTELAKTYKLSGNLRQALDQYWQCWKLSTSVSDKLAFVKPLSELYYDLGQHNEFEEKLKQLSKVDTSSVASVLALANIYQDIGDLSNAKFQLARALDRQPDNQDLLEQLVKVSTELGNMEDALNYQQLLVDAHPNAVHQQKLGELLYDVGREQEAVQAWTKLIHAKNQTLEAEIKLSHLLIRHGLLEEALLTLDRAAEKATDAIDIYKIGALLVEMNELERAEPHFQRILEMPTPPAKPSAATTTAHISHATPYTPYMPYGLTTISMGKLNIPRNLVYQIQGQPYYSGRSAATWQPNSFEEAQAGALVQLTTIAQKQGKLNKLIEQYEANAAAHPKDIKTLETLLQVYTLFNNSEKVNEITEHLLSISPNDPAYQSMRLNQLTQQNVDYETWKADYDKMTALTPDARTRLAIHYASISFYTGKIANAEKVFSELENMEVTDLRAGLMLVPILAELGKMDQVEKILAQMRIPAHQTNTPTVPTGMPYIPMQQQGFQSQIYSTLAIAYLNNGQTEKAIEHFWAHLERTKPKTTNSKRVASLTYASYSSGGYTTVQSSFPSPTIYYNRDRLLFLQQFFNTVLIRNHQEVLYSKLQAEFDAANESERIYPGLALSYCYWWAGKRNEAQEILSALQKEFPNDLTLKLNTCFVSMNVGEHKTALTLLKEMIEADPRNRRQYNQLMFQLAVYTGDTVTVRELMTKLLNSPSGTRELYQFSQKLQNAGLTQFALAIAKKAVDMSKGERDPNFLMQLSQHLERLGRRQDAARLAERALQFANQRDRHGQTMHQWNFQHASRLVSNTPTVQNREPKLLEAVQKNPNSFRAQLNLAKFYERAKQYQKASNAFEAALALRPKDSTTRQQYAQMLQQSGPVNKAVEQYNILIKENPSALGYNTHRIIDAFSNAGKINELISFTKEMIAPSFGQNAALDFARRVAQHLLRHNNPKAAVEIYEKIIKVNPNDRYTYTQLISAYENVGETEKAMQFLRESMENTNLLNATQPFAQVELILKLIELYKKSGKLKELATEYEEKLSQEPNDPLLMFPVALMKIGLNNFEDSDPLVEQLFKNTPLMIHLGCANVLADAYRSAGDRDREIRVLEIATQKVNPQNSWGLPESYRKLGTAYMQKGEKIKGQDTFRKMGAIFMSGGSGHGYWEIERLAQTYMQYAMWDDAAALYTEISNNLSANRSSREQAQRQLMMIKQMQRGLTATTRSSQKTENMDIGAQKALAEQHSSRGENTKAIQIYEQIVKQMPEDFESRSKLASLYSRQKRHDKALETWNALLKADPENSKYQDGLINAYRASGKINEALELAQKYLEVEPTSSAHHVRIARLYAADGQVEKAIAAYKKTIELKPGDRRIYEDLARLYTQNSEFDAAEETYKEAIKFAERDWDKERIERQLMDLYRRQGKLEEMLKDAEEKGTLTYKMQTEIAKQYKDKGESQKAITAYKKALTLATQDHERRNISFQLMEEYAKIGEDKLVLEQFETAYNPNSISLGGKSITSSGTSITAIRFGNDNVRDNLIKTYQDQGKLDKLQSIFEERLKSKPKNITVLQILSDIYRNTHDHKKAAEIYQTLSDVQPNNIRSYYYAAASLNRTGQSELAKHFLNRGEAALSSSNYRNDMLVHAAFAIICLEGDMPEQAVKYAEQAVAKGTGGGDIFRDGVYGLLGRCYFETKQYEEAANAYQQLANITRSDWKRKEAEKAIQRAYREGNLHETRIPKLVKMAEENPDDPDVRLSLAKSYESSNQVDEAIAQYEKLIELQPDTSEWHKTIGDLYQKSRKTHGAERLAKVTAAYEKAIKLEPNTYQLYEKLGQIYTQGSELEQAESVYRRALDAQLDEYEYNRVINAIWSLYDSQTQREKGIAVLEELKPKMPTSSTLHELLADAYKNIGDTEKSELVYSQWLEIRQKQVSKRQYHGDFNRLAEQLLNLNIYPEVALDYAQRAIKSGDNPKYGLTLGIAYLANEQYDAALEQLKSSLNTIKPKDIENQLLSRISAFGKNAQDKEGFTEMVEQLVNAISNNLANELSSNIALAKFGRELGLTEIAKTYIKKTGFIPESAWLFLGPFDNTKGVGYNTTYIPEDAKQFDTTTKYDAVNGQVSWQKIADDTYDGFIDFGADDNWYTGYAWVTVISPDERKAQFLFDSDDQGKVWLNGKKMYAHRRARGAVIDRRSIPVTLMAGKNSILVKVCNETLPWGFYLRITDSDGDPFNDLTFSNSAEN